MTKSDKRRVNKLSGVRIAELSAVDNPANQHSLILLAKSRGGAGATAIRFSPIMFKKARDDSEPDDADDADDAQEDEDPADGEDDMDDDEITAREADALRRARTKTLRKMVRDKFMKADRDFSDGKSGGISYSESDRVGRQDARSAEEKAADLSNVARAAVASPPAASEAFSDWCGRVYGNQLAVLDAPELRTARRCYDAMMTGTVLKRRANDTLMQIAKAMHAADPSRGLYSHWAIAAKNHPELYSAVRDRGPVLKAGDPTVAESIGRVPVPLPDLGSYSATGDAGPGYTTLDNGFGGGADTRSALDVLKDHAAEIRKASMSAPKPLSAAQSFVKACQVYPELYAAHKRGA